MPNCWITVQEISRKQQVGDPPLPTLEQRFEVSYSHNEVSNSVVVGYNTARLLEIAIEAGKQEKASEIRKALGL